LLPRRRTRHADAVGAQLGAARVFDGNGLDAVDCSDGVAPRGWLEFDHSRRVQEHRLLPVLVDCSEIGGRARREVESRVQQQSTELGRNRRVHVQRVDRLEGKRKLTGENRAVPRHFRFDTQRNDVR